MALPIYAKYWFKILCSECLDIIQQLHIKKDLLGKLPFCESTSLKQSIINSWVVACSVLQPESMQFEIFIYAKFAVILRWWCSVPVLTAALTLVWRIQWMVCTWLWLLAYYLTNAFLFWTQLTNFLSLESWSYFDIKQRGNFI